ncbi:hypothetical protein SASPL_101784 [Salvia splendens]|uniref:Uncharacterized protein n=1 Tax=Salvia splendens TaxID=180675 RepID=A0A8X8YVH2_SALSN|nr:hypothetical protein SASPL_101784 [Salvia splendens]
MKGYNLCRLNLRMNVFHLGRAGDQLRPLADLHHRAHAAKPQGVAAGRDLRGAYPLPPRGARGIRSLFAGIRHQFDDSFLNLSGFAAIRRRFDDSFLSRSGSVTGRKGKLGIAADIFSVAPSIVVVEVKKSSGDTLEYNQFCSKELRPALKDIVWTGNFVPA